MLQQQVQRRIARLGLHPLFLRPSSPRRAPSLSSSSSPILSSPCATPAPSFSSSPVSFSSSFSCSAPSPVSPCVLAHLIGNNGVLVLTLNQPRRMNVLSREMMTALQRELSAAGENTAVRVVVLCAAEEGPAFCAGHDLRELVATGSKTGSEKKSVTTDKVLGGEEWKVGEGKGTRGGENDDRDRRLFTDIMQQCASLMQQIVTHPKPIIAVVDGLATAAGCQLVASCDLAFASSRAKFCTPGVNIGLFCSTPMVALSRNVAPKHAMHMLLTGETIDAQTALRYGLVNQVIEGNFLPVYQTAMRCAAVIASKSQCAVTMGKQAFYRQLALPLSEAYEHCAQVMVDNLRKEDAQEGIASFLEKRTPSWRDC